MQPASKKTENAWAMYDWANSAYNLVITTTIFPAYYVGVTSSKIKGEPSYVDFFGYKIINTVLQDYALAIVFMIVAFSSPILSSIADYRKNKKVYLRWFSLLGAVSCSALFFFTPEKIEYGMIFFALAALGYWSSLVFYNSYLPDIVPVEERDRVSAKGFAFGYIGSVLLQIICFIIILFPPNLDWMQLTQPSAPGYLSCWLVFGGLALRRSLCGPCLWKVNRSEKPGKMYSQMDSKNSK